MVAQHDFDLAEIQFLCCYPVNSINWQKIAPKATWDEQKRLLDCTYNHSLNRSFPIKTDYQLKFLKDLINHLEQSTEEVHDEIYEAFCKLQSAEKEEGTFSYKHYSLPKFDTIITLKESRSFAAEGTTGLCSWQASLALSDWLLHNGHLVRGKSIIELGSGTGLCGFIVSKCCKAEKVTLTDGSTVVLNVLKANRDINFPLAKDIEEKVSIVHLPWGACELIQAKKFDVILAADVVYDSSEFNNLIYAIDHLFQLMENKTQLILAATVRNEDTLKQFLSLLESKEYKLKVEDVVPLEESHLFWNRSEPVRIMIVTRENH